MLSRSQSDFEDGVDEVSVRSFQGLLDFQTPWGEWGESGHDYAERFKRIGREALLVQIEKLAKPNMFRTLRGIETLKWLTVGRFKHRIDKALDWVKKQMKDGWFETWVERPLGLTSEQPKEIVKLPDVRHTAQAVLANIKFRRVTYESIRAIEKLLDNQLKEGGWPNDLLVPRADIHSTVFATELLYALKQRTPKSQITKLGKDDLLARAQPALDRAKAWLYEQNRKGEGLWQNSYTTALVLDRIGIALLTDYPSLIQASLERIYEEWDGQGWVDKRVRESEKREASRVHTTLRITSCLTWLAYQGVSVDSRISQDARQYVINSLPLGGIDAPNFVDVLRIFGLEKRHLEVIRAADYYDYFTEDKAAALINKERNKEILGLWLAQSCTRLEKLEKGMKLGVTDYSSVYSEEKTKLYSILKSLANISENQDIEDLALNLAQASDSEAFVSNINKMNAAEDSTSGLQKVVKFGKSTAYSIYTEFLPRLVAELLKPS